MQMNTQNIGSITNVGASGTAFVSFTYFFSYAAIGW